MTMPTVETQARRYLRLFPAWMRDVRGEEAVGLVLDQIPAGAARLPVRSRIDLVRAGLHARRVGRPPWKVRHSVAYATPSSGRGVVPPEWRPWLLAGLPRRSFALGFAVERTWSVFLMLAVFGAMPSGGGSWRPWYAVPALVLWALGIGWSTLRSDRWRATLYVRNGFQPDGTPLLANSACDQWTDPLVPNAWMLPALVAGTGVWFAAAVAGWPAFGSPGDGILLFWLGVAALTVMWLAVVDNLIRWRTDPRRAVPPVVAGAPPRGRSVGVVALSLLSSAVAVVIVVGVTLIAGVLGLAGLARWVLVASGVIVIVRWHQAERSQQRVLGLWDLFPATGPVYVRSVVLLPQPPDVPTPPAQA